MKMFQFKSLKFSTATPICAALFTLLLIVFTTDVAAQSRERLWNVTCGLPQQNNPLLELLPAGGYNGPWLGDPRSGHLEVRTLNRPHPDGGVSGEMWLLSRSIGWWRLKAIRVHPDDRSKITFDTSVNQKNQVRQIIESPFLAQPAVIRAGTPGEEELVTGQILALLPNASQLRCDPQSNGS